MTRKYNNQIKAVDLFCGAGGLTHGLLNSGINVSAGIDLDPACRYPYEANNDGAVFLERDVTSLRSKEIAEYFEEGDIRVLAGCAPCQPFSSYSQRYDTQKDGKWELLNHFTRMVKSLKPEIVTMENVPSLRRHEVFEKFVNTLKRSGYNVWYDVVESEKYGVPQTRKRTVLLASMLGPISMIERTQHKPITVKKAIGRLKEIKAGEGSVRDPLHTSASLSPINLKRIRVSKPGGTWRDWPTKLVAACHKKDSGNTYPAVYGRMEWQKPAPTMTTQCFGYGNGRFGHPEQDRAISLREAAILQSFPKKYKFVEKGKKVEFTPLGRLIGNAVPVKLGEAIGRSIIEHIKTYTGYMEEVLNEKKNN